jgi:hypothetical protein
MREPTARERQCLAHRGLSLEKMAIIDARTEQLRRRYGNGIEVDLGYLHNGRFGIVRDVHVKPVAEMLIQFEDGEMVWFDPEEVRVKPGDGKVYQYVGVRPKRWGL